MNNPAFGRRSVILLVTLFVHWQPQGGSHALLFPQLPVTRSSAPSPAVVSRTASARRGNPRPARQRMSSLLLSSQPPPPRQPRRMLKKRRPKDGDGNSRRNRRNSAGAPTAASPGGGGSQSTGGGNSLFSFWDGKKTEVRPLVPSVRRDLGEDYWIDPADLDRERQREEERSLREQQYDGKNNRRIPKEKLWTEVKAPYQQNWIGYFSVAIAILSVIVLKFPELLDAPTIQLPDL